MGEMESKSETGHIQWELRRLQLIRHSKVKGINKKMLQVIIYLAAFPWVSDVATFEKLSQISQVIM